MWYLNEELLPLVLLRSPIDMKENSKIVEEMKQYTCEGQTGTEFGKPEIPDILKQDDLDSLSLPSFA